MSLPVFPTPLPVRPPWRRQGRVPLAASIRVAAAAAVLLLAAGCQTPSVLGPYVQRVTGTSALVVWHTPAPEVGRLRYRAADGSARGEATDPGARTVHVFQIEGLRPGTRVEYGASGGVGDASWLHALGSFRTAAPPGQPSVRFVVLGDNGEGNEAEAAVVAKVVEHHPDLVLHTGDMAFPDGRPSAFPGHFFEPFRELLLEAPLYPALGNHDVNDDRAAAWLHFFHNPENALAADGKERYYSFDHGDVHFVALDTETSDHAVGSAQYTWLELDLAATSRSWKVVFFHRPPFSSGRHGGSSSVRRNLVPLFVRHGVDVVFAGHDHDYERLGPIQGVTYVVTGGAGRSLRDLEERDPHSVTFLKEYHFVLADQEGATLRLRAIGVEGQVLDEVVLRK